ncbi:MAG: cytochrome c oxidase subunit II [Planctomycetes bacterium]|nr:cytochrome c oxidase subunit II [Planctomycetota bacterium]
MARLWGLLFLTVPVAGTGAFVWASRSGHWFPRNTSSFGAEIDGLFYVILWITATAFVATTGLLGWLLLRHAERPGARARYTHGNLRVEGTLAALTTGMLLYIAVTQFGTWKKVKFASGFPDVPTLAHVTAGQFEWRITYPGADGEFGTPDDVHSLNDFHVPVDRDAVFVLQSRDVLHSFFLPHMRVKQDAVPGLRIPVWFRPLEEGTFDLVCAELCGWGHFKMRGRLTVQSPEAFAAWLAQRKAEEEAANP